MQTAGMERARERLRDATSVFAAAEATYWEQRQGNGEVEGDFSQYMGQLQDKKHALTGEVLKYLGLQWVAPSAIPTRSGESVESSPQTNGLHAPPHGAGVGPHEQGRPNVKPDGAWPTGEELQLPRNRPGFEDQASIQRGGNRCNLQLEDVHLPAPYDGSTEWDHRETAGNIAPSTPTPGGSGGGCTTSSQDALTAGRVRGGGGGLGDDDTSFSWRQPCKPLQQHQHRELPPAEIMTPPWVVPPRVEDAGNPDGTGAGGGMREPRPPSPISALPAVLVESGPPTVVTAFTHHADGSSVAQAAAPMDDRGASTGLRLVPSFVVSEDVSSRRVSSTSLGRESSFTTNAAASSPGSPAFDSDHAMMSHHSRGWGGGHIHTGDDAAGNAADRVVVLRDGLPSTTTTSRAMVGAKRSWGMDGGPSSEGVDSGGGGGGRSSVRRHSVDAVAAGTTAAGGLSSSRKLQRLDRSKSGAVRSLKGSQACRDAGCHRRPIYAFKGDTKALCCPIHRSKEMVNVRHPLCRHESCFRQPSFGIEGDQRASFCSEHKLPEMINVSSRRCQATGCLRHPNFGFQGDRRATYCCRHKAPGMIDVVSRRCQHPQCVRRPLYAMTGQRAMFCRTHKDAGMTDVVSRRCNFEEGCDRHPSFGWKQGDGKARRCAHHRLEGMESVKVNRRGALKRASGK